MIKQEKKAFTLAETLITLTILGVVAAITVPSLINKQSESVDRTKLKKAMTTQSIRRRASLGPVIFPY